MKKIYIAYTGGTIGMERSASGWIPAPGHLELQMRGNPAFQSPGMPAYKIREFETLLDSANMSPEHWLLIAQDIEAHIDQYDGIVVLHGTDTMAYTASALAFMLENLSKPVVLTGSQVPLVEPRSDALLNLVTSMLIAAYEDIPEVCLYFDQELYRGCRAVKANSESFTAFASPRYPPSGRGRNRNQGQSKVNPPAGSGRAAVDGSAPHGPIRRCFMAVSRHHRRDREQLSPASA